MESDGYEIWHCADQAERIKRDFEELVRTGHTKAKQVRCVSFGTDEFWKSGPTLAKIEKDMTEHVDSMKNFYPGHVRIIYGEDMVALPMPMARSQFRSSASDTFGGRVGKWWATTVVRGRNESQG